MSSKLGFSLPKGHCWAVSKFVSRCKRFDRINDIGRKKDFDQLFDIRNALLCSLPFRPNFMSCHFAYVYRKSILRTCLGYLYLYFQAITAQNRLRSIVGRPTVKISNHAYLPYNKKILNAVVLNLFHCWDPLNATDVVWWDPQVKIEKVCAPE